MVIRLTTPTKDFFLSRASMESAILVYCFSLYVCLSVMLWYYIQTNALIIKLLTVC